jgi:acyl-CoA reductase-like NAD-dependent aldehyde dehydrogenase
MSRHHLIPLAALIAVLFVFVDGARSQPRAADRGQVAASAAEHKGMHGMTAEERAQHRKEMRDKMQAGKDHDCMRMMDKHGKQTKANGQDHADHADPDKTAAADKDCGMGKKH